MAFEFLKRIFGSSKPTEVDTTRQRNVVPVPESVLDRFLVHAPEIYYYDSKTRKTMFVARGKKLSINPADSTKSMMVFMSLFWLQEQARHNRNLFMSIIRRYGQSISITTEAEMHNFLWSYFRNGQSTKDPQLTQFYRRGKSIINFLDTMSAYTLKSTDDFLTDEAIENINSRYGETESMSSIEGMNEEILSKIILRDYQLNIIGDNRVVSSKQDTISSRKQQTSTTSQIECYLLLFSAEWCGPSKRFKKEIIEGGVTNFSYFDVDKDTSLSSKYKINSVPTALLIDKDGNVIKKWVGYDDEDPGQSQFIKFVKSGKYNIKLFPGCKPYHAVPASSTPSKSRPIQKESNIRVPAASLNKPINASPIKKDVDSSIAAFENDNVPYLQNCLFQLVSKLNKPGSGTLITNYPEKDRLCECFSLCLRYDWMNDPDIREVWAENGFYCIIDYLGNNVKSKEDLIAGTLDLFLHIQYSGEALKPKVSEILRKAQMRSEQVFDQSDYVNGAGYLLQQIAYFAALPLKPLATQLFKGEMLSRYHDTINDSQFSPFTASDAFPKAQFIAKIIESILKDM